MSQIPNHRRAAGALALVVAAALALVGCAPGGAASVNNSQEPASKTVPSTPVTLTLAHYEVGALASAIDQLAAAYEKKHPNVTVKTQFTSFTDYGKRVKLQMSAQNPPDIAEAGQGFTMMGPLVEAKLLRPLDDYAKLYGWGERFGPGLLDQSRFQPDGKRFGSGSLYGIALGGNMVGVYYNKQVLQTAGIDPSSIRTVDDLSAAMAKAKQSRVLPLELGNSEQWEANHVLSSILSQYTTQEELTSWIYGNKGATFTAPSFLEGTKALQDWVTAGYIDPAANGLSNDDAVARFASGKAAFFISGNWVLDQVAKATPDAGFMAFPPLKAGASLRATGATSSPFAISSQSKHPDVAANFIDFMSGPEATSTLAKAGYLPLIASNERTGGTALSQQFTDVWKKVLADDGLTLYLDWASVGMGNALFPALQEMLGGRTTPDALSQTVQSDWTSAHPQ